jgi:hypothetical protein
MKKNLKVVGLWLFCLVLLAALLGAVGCAPSKVNKDNFDKIRLGMTQEEVQGLLGPPTEASGLEIPVFSGTTAKWVQGETVITIQFINDKVVAKEFSKQAEK